MIDYLSAIRAESERFNQAVSALAASSPDAFANTSVPSCPDWTAADLTWHLAEVQYFWAAVVEKQVADGSDVEPLERPDDNELVALHRAKATELVEVLASRDTSEPSWSWHSQGTTVGWVMRRQAHEALIHRVDAELTAGSAGAAQQSPIDEVLALDGIDEMLSVMLDIGTLPSGLRFEASDRTVRLAAPGRSWNLTLGQVVGTAPSGSAVDLGAIDLSREVQQPTASIEASASELDLWLWRRGPLADSAFTGDRSVVDDLYALANIE